MKDLVPPRREMSTELYLKWVSREVVNENTHASAFVAAGGTNL